ncbi:MAG: alpha/beta hydrolase [Gammaproteobacteria bacterium]|nr:alpha/beta hydrolase [Gammaproteobacteria bacterium]
MSTRADIEFDAEGVRLRGWLYTPTGRGPHPLVVMSHGFSAVKEMGLDDYAEVFSAAGLAVLVYDNRNLGASDGLPRQDIDPVAQRRDQTHAITFARSMVGIDPERIGLWGTSYSGGLALITAALDRRVKCVVAQVPYLHGLRTLDLVMPLAEHAAFHARLDAERCAIAAGAAPSLTDVCSDDPSRPPESPGRRSWAWFNHYVESGRARWTNAVTVRSLERRLEYDALAFVPRIAPTPLLLIAAAADDITPTALALEAFELARAPKRLELVPGHHYRPYLEDFPRASAAARDWFLTHL